HLSREDQRVVTEKTLYVVDPLPANTTSMCQSLYVNITVFLKSARLSTAKESTTSLCYIYFAVQYYYIHYRPFSKHYTLILTNQLDWSICSFLFIKEWSVLTYFSVVICTFVVNSISIR
ncbi:hypothetical protein PHYSODRAFT_485898, partial [Phytophthora sojae]